MSTHAMRRPFFYDSQNALRGVELELRGGRLGRKVTTGSEGSDVVKTCEMAACRLGRSALAAGQVSLRQVRHGVCSRSRGNLSNRICGLFLQASSSSNSNSNGSRSVSVDGSCSKNALKVEKTF